MVETPLDIAGRLRTLADRLETTLEKLPACPPVEEYGRYRKAKKREQSILFRGATIAGKLLLLAIDQGGIFADDPKIQEILVPWTSAPDEKRQHAAFLGLWQHWLTPRHSELPITLGLGNAYADAMRLFAQEIDSTTPAPAVKDQVSKDQAVENPDIPDPDETLVLNIKGKGRAILLYLWKRGLVGREELRKAVWKKQKITDKGIDKAINDLNTKLTQLLKTGCKTQVVARGGMYLLQHPQK